MIWGWEGVVGVRVEDMVYLGVGDIFLFLEFENYEYFIHVYLQ